MIEWYICWDNHYVSRNVYRRTCVLSKTVPFLLRRCSHSSLGKIPQASSAKLYWKGIRDGLCGIKLLITILWPGVSQIIYELKIRFLSQPLTALQANKKSFIFMKFRKWSHKVFVKLVTGHSKHLVFFVHTTFRQKYCVKKKFLFDCALTESLMWYTCPSKTSQLME